MKISIKYFSHRKEQLLLKTCGYNKKFIDNIRKKFIKAQFPNKIYGRIQNNVLRKKTPSKQRIARCSRDREFIWQQRAVRPIYSCITRTLNF